jgi:predicted ATPase
VNWTILEPGVAEANINVSAEKGEPTARAIRGLLRQCIVYQFHNTSTTARIKQRWNKDDGRFLKEDGGNLGPFLLRLKESAQVSYSRIVGTIRQAVPFFSDFVLEPINGSLLLQWREIGCDMVFSSYQAADGMLRFFALVALLLQPEEDIPYVLIIDEPELGLHPQAIELVAGLLRSVSRKRQVFIATQSTLFVDQFRPDDIVVVNRINRVTEMKRLEPSDLKDWLKDFEGGRGYSLSELWEKNVVGGGPSQ